MSPVRACLGCGSLTSAGSRCDPCRRELVRRRSTDRGTPQEQGYGPAWRKVRAVVLRRDAGACAYCGGPAGTVDHVIPKSRGGTDDPSNLVAACLRCNSAKRDR